ncbi:DUF4407 domain-containing protein [Urechidicola sp. KH5]
MLTKFFWICSGADIDILEKSSKAEQQKYVGIGGTVFFTAVMATLAAGYALYTVFDNVYIALIFGLVWGLLIFNLDRFIVSTIKKSDSKWKEIAQATPRLILAVIIAVVISKPLELKIFEKEIDRVLLEQKNDYLLANKKQIAIQYAPEIQQLQAGIAQLKNEVALKEQAVDTLYETYIAEAEGRKGTQLVGKGPVYKEKRDKHDAALAELKELKIVNQDKIEANEAAIASLQIAQKERETSTAPIITGFDGLMARINALDKLPLLPSLFIFLLFLAIETAPIFAKLISPRGVYDMQLADNEDAIKTWVAQKVQQRKEIFKTDSQLNEEIYSDLTEEEELYNYKRKKARELLQQQADAFHMSQQKIV